MPIGPLYLFNVIKTITKDTWQCWQWKKISPKKALYISNKRMFAFAIYNSLSVSFSTVLLCFFIFFFCLCFDVLPHPSQLHSSLPNSERNSWKALQWSFNEVQLQMTISWANSSQLRSIVEYLTLSKKRIGISMVTSVLGLSRDA